MVDRQAKQEQQGRGRRQTKGTCPAMEGEHKEGRRTDEDGHRRQAKACGGHQARGTETHPRDRVAGVLVPNQYPVPDRPSKRPPCPRPPHRGSDRRVVNGRFH